MIPQLGGLRTKSQELVISFCLDEGENTPQFHLKDIQFISEFSCWKIKQYK